MSDEDDKSTLNDVDDAAAADQSNGDREDDDDGQTENLLGINGNENTPPCQLDIGLGTHTDSRRHDNSNSNDSGESSTTSTKREDNLLSFRHFLCNNGTNQTSKPKVEVVPSVSQPVRPVTETSTLPDFVQDHLTTDQPYDNGDLDSRSNSIDLTRGINRPSMFGNRSNRTPQQCVVMPLDLPLTNTTTSPRATTPTTTNSSLPDFLSDGPIGVPVVHPVPRNEQPTERNRISIIINPQRGARPINQNYIRFQRHSQAVEARVTRLEATEQDLRTTVLNLNNMLQQALLRAQRAEDEVRTLRHLLRARDEGLNSSLATISSTNSAAEQIRHGTRNAEILLNLLRDNYQDLNNVAVRLEQQETIQTSTTQLSDDPSDSTDNNIT